MMLVNVCMHLTAELCLCCSAGCCWCVCRKDYYEQPQEEGSYNPEYPERMAEGYNPVHKPVHKPVYKPDYKPVYKPDYKSSDEDNYSKEEHK
jgi:hypothetical protein